MAELALYCLPVDVIRKFNPQLTQNSLDQNDYIGNNDRQQIRARIDSICSSYENQTGRVFRRRRIGAKGNTATYEHQNVQGEQGFPPMRASLRYDQVLPFDSNEDDVLEVRTGKNDWDDITDEAGDEFVLNHRDGTLELYRWLIDLIYWDARDQRYLRTSYRCGALGGNPDLGGETTLDGSITDSDTSINVVDATGLPARGVLLLGNGEYARLTNTDRSTDTLTVERGIRSSSAEAHDDGDLVHYCPEYIRDGVAAKVAIELLNYDDWVDELTEAGGGRGASDKIDTWESEWQVILERESGVKLL